MSVPTSTDGDGAPLADLDSVVRALARGSMTVLSGAGLSTESGIPAYRNPDGRRLNTPMTIAELRAHPAARQRYWARSYLGWPRFATAHPNRGHKAVTALQRRGVVGAVITQNVDGLHQAAGTEQVLELHGSLAGVVCMECAAKFRRTQVQDWMSRDNPGFVAHAAPVTVAARPDGDVELAEGVVETFHTPTCPTCGSDRLKPDVVMFGDSVPPPLVQQCHDAVSAASGLLVLGSSLMVMSGLRFVRAAVGRGQPVVAITQGRTRADDLIDLKVQAPLGATLTAILERLDAPVD